ncbi:MAG: NAD(P)-dependent glycerol-3-phosphate dehydrogenase [Ruminococcus sp.]|nr:NAD(P)-dependent glycerol-3-phosphate dehydrogenase [Ruminococcus sp.]
MAKITVLGAGGFGIALAVLMHNSGHDVTVWSAFPAELDEIRREGEQKTKLPGVPVPKEIHLCEDISCVKEKDLVLIGVPSLFVRDTAKKILPHLSEGTIIANTAKGLEDGSLKPLSLVLEEELAGFDIVVLTGPSHAEEVGLGIPTTIVAASKSKSAAMYTQETLSSPTFRIYLNDDVLGCELGGALKNIIALCAGVCDGLGYGDNTKAALMTRGIHEISRLGVALGAKVGTFAGLAGIGDLIVTCTSMHSRNRRAGILIGQGVSPEEAIRQIGTVEGYYCCHAAHALAQKVGVDLPITEQLYNVLFEGADVKQALGNLMNRPKRHESEEMGFELTEEKNA